MPSEHTPVVLLVEDEPFVRMSTADALIDSGFAVVEAQDAEEALGVVGGCPQVNPFSPTSISARGWMGSNSPGW